MVTVHCTVAYGNIAWACESLILVKFSHYLIIRWNCSIDTRWPGAMKMQMYCSTHLINCDSFLNHWIVLRARLVQQYLWLPPNSVKYHTISLINHACMNKRTCHTQWHSQGLPGWARTKMRKKIQKNWGKMRENTGKKKKSWGNVLIMPTRECKAGYGPGHTYEK